MMHMELGVERLSAEHPCDGVQVEEVSLRVEPAQTILCPVSGRHSRSACRPHTRVWLSTRWQQDLVRLCFTFQLPRLASHTGYSSQAEMHVHAFPPHFLHDWESYCTQLVSARCSWCAAVVLLMRDASCVHMELLSDVSCVPLQSTSVK